MNNIVTYADASTAWLTSTGVLSLVASTVYEKFAGRGYLSGVKVIRGYSEPSAKSSPIDKIQDEEKHMGGSANEEARVEPLESQTESQRDNDVQEGRTQGRETEHLVLVTHGIGQSISIRYLSRLKHPPL